jgi:hypothetical protein
MSGRLATVRRPVGMELERRTWTIVHVGAGGSWFHDHAPGEPGEGHQRRAQRRANDNARPPHLDRQQVCVERQADRRSPAAERPTPRIPAGVLRDSLHHRIPAGVLRGSLHHEAESPPPTALRLASPINDLVGSHPSRISPRNSRKIFRARLTCARAASSEMPMIRAISG